MSAAGVDAAHLDELAAVIKFHGWFEVCRVARQVADELYETPEDADDGLRRNLEVVLSQPRVVTR